MNNEPCQPTAHEENPHGKSFSFDDEDITFNKSTPKPSTPNPKTSNPSTPTPSISNQNNQIPATPNPSTSSQNVENSHQHLVTENNIEKLVKDLNIANSLNTSLLTRNSNLKNEVKEVTEE